jgi:hypothetical protein
MEGLLKYLSRYKNLTPPHASAKKIFVKTIQDECGITLAEEDVSVKKGGVVMSCHPTVRSELLRYAPYIIEVLHKKHNIRILYIR